MPGAATGTQGVLRGRVWAAMCQLLNICLWQRGKCIGAQITGPKIGRHRARQDAQGAETDGVPTRGRQWTAGIGDARARSHQPADGPSDEVDAGTTCGQCANFCSSCCETANLTMALTALRKTNAGLAMAGADLEPPRPLVQIGPGFAAAALRRFDPRDRVVCARAGNPVDALCDDLSRYFSGSPDRAWIRRLMYSTSFAGLVPLLGFSQGLTQGTISLSSNSDLLLNTVFPPELVPLRETASRDCFAGHRARHHGGVRAHSGEGRVDMAACTRSFSR